MISSVPSSVIFKICLISSIVKCSEKMLRSVYGMSCSCNHAFALRQDVQLGEVNNVTIHLTLLFFMNINSLDFNFYMIKKLLSHFYLRSEERRVGKECR